MDIREASYIIEIEKAKNLTTAANNLFITQPALSKVLKKLEAEFNSPVFYKEGKDLLPTPIGNILLQHSKTIVREFSAMNHDVMRITNSGQARLCLGLPLMGGFMYAPILAAFAAQYPTIQLTTLEAGANDLFAAFTEKYLDLAISPSPEDNRDFNETLLFRSQIAVAVNASHPWALKKYLLDEDFIDIPFITFPEDARINSMLSARFHDKFTPVYRMIGREVLTMMATACATDAPIVLPEPYLRFYNWTDMAILPFSPDFPWSMGLIYPKESRLSKAARLFLDFTEDYMLSHQNYYVPLGIGDIDLSEYVAIH